MQNSIAQIAGSIADHVADAIHDEAGEASFGGFDDNNLTPGTGMESRQMQAGGEIQHHRAAARQIHDTQHIRTSAFERHQYFYG